MALLAVMTGCKKGNDPTTGCPTDRMCTNDFRTLHLELTDAMNQSVALDSYYTRKMATGETFSMKGESGSWADSLQKANGSYPIIGDGQMNKTSTGGMSFEFTGIKNGTVVIRKQLLIKHDCCHIGFADGTQYAKAVVL